MPKKYEEMRDEFIAQGIPETEAKTRAAKLYNAQREPGSKPITRPHKRTPGGAVIRRRF